MQRRFVAEEPDRLWCTDMTEHPTQAGKVYCCAVLAVFSRPWWASRLPTTRDRAWSLMPCSGDLATSTWGWHDRPALPNTCPSSDLGPGQ